MPTTGTKLPQIGRLVGPSRQELTCVAFALLEIRNGTIAQKNVVFLTDIIEHTSLATGEFFREALQHLGATAAVTLEVMSTWRF